MREATCGSFTIEHPPGPVSAHMHQETIQVFKKMGTYLSKEARTWLASDKKYMREVQQKTADAIQHAIYSYDYAIRVAAARAIQQGEEEGNRANKAFYEEAKKAGWVMAGAWFWTMAGINRQISDAIGVRPHFTSIDGRGMGSIWRVELENELIRTNSTVIPKIESAGIASGGRFQSAGIAGGGRLGDVGDFHQKVAKLTKKGFDPIIENISATFLEGGHAEAKLQSLGTLLINGVEGMLYAMAIANMAVSAADAAVDSNPARFIPGLGSAISGASEALKSVVSFVTRFLGIVGIPLVLFGLLLAFYFPAIPFINWFAAVIGWLVMLIEAVFAAPFWAAAHAVPEGDGISGQHGRAGWMLVLSLVARPVLMIAGLVGAMLLLHYGSELLLIMFAPFAKGMTAGSITGIFSILGMLAILLVMVLTMAKTAFSLVYVIPDRTLAWIGQSAANLGETQTGEESKTMIVAAGQGGDKMVKEAVNKIGGKKEGEGQDKGGYDKKSADSKQATNDAEEELHAPGNMVAKGESQGQKAAGQEGQHGAGGAETSFHKDDKNT